MNINLNEVPYPKHYQKGYVLSAGCCIKYNLPNKVMAYKINPKLKLLGETIELFRDMRFYRPVESMYLFYNKLLRIYEWSHIYVIENYIYLNIRGPNYVLDINIEDITI